MGAWTVLRIVAILALVINVASAHHPFSVNYDAAKFATLTGNVAAKGNRITVSGWHARDATLKIFSGREVTFEDGSRRVFGGGPGNLWKCVSGDCPTATWIPSIVK